jgi:hypothetical protein
VEAITGRDRLGHLRDTSQQLQDLFENISPIPLHGVVNKLTGNFHPGQTAGDYVRSGLGLTSKPNNTPAEDLAYKLASQNSSSGRVPSDQLAHFHRVMDFEDRMREGDKGAALELRRELQSGSVSVTDYQRAMKGATVSRLQSVVNRLPMMDAIDVWNQSTKDEREQLTPIMVKKIADFRRTEGRKYTVGERNRMDTKIAATMSSMFEHAGL